jgi:hypothetical protein
MTTTQLPAVVSRYLQDPHPDLFTPDATVTDEGRTYTGIDEILAWRNAVAAAYTYTTKVTGIRSEGDGRWVVRVHLEGDFPGGVADLDQDFLVRDERIAVLVIA